MHETKETTPREAITETVSTKPYWCFSIGGRRKLEEQRRTEEEEGSLELTQGIEYGSGDFWGGGSSKPCSC